jgi:hypothetical protein
LRLLLTSRSVREAGVLLMSQLQFRVIAAENGAQRLDYKLMIGALGEPGDGYAAHDARAFYGERKRSAM